MKHSLSGHCLKVAWRLIVFLLLVTSGLIGCERPAADQFPTPVTASSASHQQSDVATPTLTPSRTPQLVTTIAVSPTVPSEPEPSPPVQATQSPTAVISGCGQLLPIFPPDNTINPITGFVAETTALAQLDSMLPAAANAAWTYIQEHPEHVGLVAFRVGAEANGVYLNGDIAMPLASVAKLIHLVAYVEAVANGELNPLQSVPVADLDALYLPGLDLGSHNRAIADLDEQGRVTGNPPQVALEDIPRMMIRYSSNAATDYMHLLLGQRKIEETAVSLGLTQQTAPCPFAGQFLAMANVSRGSNNDLAALQAYLANPTSYGNEAFQLSEQFSRDEAFRNEQIAWRRETRRPNVSTQRFFSENLSPHGSAAEYARLLARIAQNGLSNAESSFQARRYLEWPMIFSDNQALFSNLGYKNGSLPGVLNTAYYAYPLGETTPVIVILFFHNLPMNTYRQWRTSLTHDEFARWLLRDTAAIPALRALFDNSLPPTDN